MKNTISVGDYLIKVGEAPDSTASYIQVDAVMGGIASCQGQMLAKSAQSEQWQDIKTYQWYRPCDELETENVLRLFELRRQNTIRQIKACLADISGSIYDLTYEQLQALLQKLHNL